jgi:hypothetical protein
VRIHSKHAMEDIDTQVRILVLFYMRWKDIDTQVRIIVLFTCKAKNKWSATGD